MTQHVIREDLIRLRARKLSPEETLAVARHLESCFECAAMAADDVDSQSVAESWSGTLHATLGDHLRGDALFDYVDGNLSPVAMADAGDHLEHCAVCREDVADLRRLRVRGWRRWRGMALGAAALLIIAAGIGVLVGRAPASLPRATAERPPAPVSTAPHAAATLPRAWRALVDAAAGSGRIAPPAVLATLRMPGDQMRGEDSTGTTAVAPNGVVVDRPRPTFRWSQWPGAVYEVSVFAGDREVARSATLRHNFWTPERDLQRGVTYRWQVEGRRGNETRIIPAAPQPAPVFRLLDDAAHRELDSALRRYPDDHLLLGVLAAHYGLEDEALRELTLHHSTHPDSRAATLLDSVREWQNGDQR